MTWFPDAKFFIDWKETIKASRPWVRGCIGVIIVTLVFGFCLNFIVAPAINLWNSNPRQELKKVQVENATLHRENLHLRQTIAPFERKAQAIYPQLETAAALSKLSKDLAELRDLATRDKYRPLNKVIVNRIQLNLRGVIAKYPELNLKAMVGVGIGRTTGVKVADELVQVLKSVGITAWIKSYNVVGSPSAINIRHHPEDRRMAGDFLNALSPFLLTDSVNDNEKGDLERGTLYIALMGVPQFRSDGSVFFE